MNLTGGLHLWQYKLEIENQEFRIDLLFYHLKQPIGVSEYRLTTKLPDKLKDTIPSIEDIKKRDIQMSSVLIETDSL
ncbi:DUF1016 domain-containing protein [Lebetimonas sp. JH292]|uniref:DUF1016 domain-containing protein n=1 Tax=Lebetimonas sp. JH292 TaxID=990068 RepID=UPI001F24F9D7|nr:DUF1016 domain-containing protein [Lebetimonas sp. JH292]